ncbi:MAG: iron-containing alcohol dehydrogenase [Syntrophorhabdus sp.]|jgi:alcohol dehydrogenase class IV|nr:iron-containing alcohol dehydrogenase [Syntrophorhabdus sp.]
MSGYDPEKVSTFLAPNKHLLGKGVARQLGGEIKTLGGSKVFVVTDPGVVKAGLVPAIIEPLKSEGMKVGVYDKVRPEPAAGIVDEAARIARSGRYDLVVGLGGGSSLDVAKGVAMMVTNTGSILDYVGLNMFPKRGIPKILVPTTAGTGSEASWVCVVTDERKNEKKSLYGFMLLPDVAMLDPVLTVSMPPSVTADTGFDALVHAIESYVSVNRTPYTEIMAGEAIRLISRNLPVAYAKGGDIKARYNMLLAANLAGMAFTSGGLGATHGLAYPLGTQYHMSHGRSNAIMLPHVMRFNLTGNLEGYAGIARMMGENIDGLSPYEASEKAVDAVMRLLGAVRISCRLSDYGVQKKKISLLTKEALQQSRFFVPNPKDITEEDIRGIYRDAY